MMIRPATSNDRDAVEALLTEVFSDDPLVSAMVAPAPDPHAALVYLHARELRTLYLPDEDRAHHTGGVVDLLVEHDEDGEHILGVALWEAPVPEQAAGQENSGWRDFLAGLDPDILGEAMKMIALDEQLCSAHHPDGDYWYLAMLAVSERARGRGVGTQLLTHGLARADAAGVPTHLESTTPGSRRLYERMGFALVAALESEQLPTYWAMRRPAQHG